MDKVNQTPKKISGVAIGLIVLTLILIGLTIAVLVEAPKMIGKCVNNVAPEFCNQPAGDFAIEPDSSSNIILSGCGPLENQKCIFTGVPSVSAAIKKCNSLGNKCNRFTYDNNTMVVVSLTGKILNIKGRHLYTRQNGITIKSSVERKKSYQNRQISGANTSITNFNFSGIPYSGSTTTGSIPSYTPSSSTPYTTTSSY